MATRTQTTVANCAWNRMGRVAQPKPCILGLTLGLWRAHESNRAASAASRGYSGMLCEWSVGGPCGVHCTLQGAGVWALRASDWPSVTLYNVYYVKLQNHPLWRCGLACGIGTPLGSWSAPACRPGFRRMGQEAADDAGLRAPAPCVRQLAFDGCQAADNARIARARSCRRHCAQRQYPHRMDPGLVVPVGKGCGFSAVRCTFQARTVAFGVHFRSSPQR